MTGVLNVYKPRGLTSSDAVVKVKKLFSTKAVGHFGTLDPMAEGVLLMGIGKATRLFDVMLDKDKVYEAEFCFGSQTDTLDSEGKIIAESGRIPSLNQIKKILPEFIGKQSQMPPRYSAKSVGGKRAYDLARSGVEFELKPSQIEIYAIKVSAAAERNKFNFNIHCSSGTYIRSVCRDIASKLKTFATMTALKRVRCGKFKIEDSLTLERLSELREKALISCEQALIDLPKVSLDDCCYEYLIKGIKMESRGICYPKFTLCCKGELFGVAKVNENAKIEIVSYLREI